MYILQNSLKNICRNKGRNIILGIIILTMLTFTAITMIINVTTNTIIENYKEQFGSEVFLQYDEQKIKEEQQNGGWVDIPEISDEIKLSLSESSYLKETMISVLYPAYSKTLKALQGTESNSSNNINRLPIDNSSYYDPNLVVQGFNTPELLKDFKDGKRKIIKGKIFANNGECVVSEDFAVVNLLNIGDKLLISDCAKDADFPPLELTIVGIYYDSTENKLSSYSPSTDRRNEILTTYETMKNYQDNIAKRKLYTISATYYLKNPELLDAFNKEAHNKGLHKNYIMATDFLSYNKIVIPAENLAKVSRIFLLAVLFIGSLILILVSILSIRERKYEIGVLRSMGMKKLSVLRGILYESLIIVSICLFLGLGIGSITAQPVADIITENRQSQNNTFGSIQYEEDEISVSLTPNAVLRVSTIAILIAVISSSVGVLYILRYEPIKILSERN